MPNESKPTKWPHAGIRVWTWRYFDATVFVGPWAIRFADPRMGGRFGNGSRWQSGWHRWREVDW